MIRAALTDKARSSQSDEATAAMLRAAKLHRSFLRGYCNHIVNSNISTALTGIAESCQGEGATPAVLRAAKVHRCLRESFRNQVDNTIPASLD